VTARLRVGVLASGAGSNLQAILDRVHGRDAEVVAAGSDKPGAQALARAAAAGVPRDLVLLDPGIGFAKTAEQGVELLARIGELRRLGRPLLVGPSRKSFIGKLTGAPAGDRVPGTLAAVTACVLAGVEIVRVHDVAPCRQAALVAAAIRDAGAARPGPR
jgi:dihydropteroate synthase